MDSLSITTKVLEANETLAEAEVIIPIPPGEKFALSLILDACQRSVAHCVESLERRGELKKVLDNDR